MASRFRRGQTGAALVEFALVLPFLAMVVMGTIDIGRAYSLQHRLTNAAREGAVFAQAFPGQVSNSGACADPENIAYHALGEDAGSASGFTVTVTNVDTGTPISGPCTRSGFSSGMRVKVTVSATFHTITPMAAEFVGASKVLTGSAEVVFQG